MIVYVKNDDDLKDSSTGTGTLPLAWMWSAISSGTHGWTAAAYLTNFWVGLLVNVTELIAWVFYLVGDNEWFGWWANGVGYYGSMIL